jgi:hypothetical protein
MLKKLVTLAVGAFLFPSLAHAERQFDHVFVIMMENHGTGEIIGNKADAPFVNQLASRSRVALNYNGVTHPSLPNYLALISGSFQGIWDDCKAGQSVTCPAEEFVPGSGDATDGNYLSDSEKSNAAGIAHWFSGKTIVDQLESKGLTWKAYMQSMPADDTRHGVEYAPIINGATVKLYAQKHNPFEYFSNIRSSSQRLKNIVPLEGNFSTDLLSPKLANFVFISPDQCHDMHGISPATASVIGNPTCGYPTAGLDHGAIKLGDKFLSDTVQAITGSPAWGPKAAIVVIWDEDEYAGFEGWEGHSPVGHGDAGTFVLGGSRAPAMVLTQKSFTLSATNYGGLTNLSWQPGNHYSMLGTLQAILGLDCLEKTCELQKKDLLLWLFGVDSQ